MSKKINVADLDRVWHTKTTLDNKIVAPDLSSNGPNYLDPASKTILMKGDPHQQIPLKVSVRKLVCIESPYMSEDPAKVQRHIDYAKLCMLDSIKRGEAPMAANLMYHQVINDKLNIEHDIALVSHLSWINVCDLVVMYSDFGISPGMTAAENHAKLKQKRIEYRMLGAVIGKMT